MKICRYNDNRLGVIDGDDVIDVSAALEVLPTVRWPVPAGDLLIAHLGDLRAEIGRLADTGDRVACSDVVLKSPVANPDKIIGAPVNYLKHQDEAQKDAGINYGSDVKTINEYGLFLKANSSLVGPGEGVSAKFPDRRIDYEVELAVVVGQGGRDIREVDAMAHVAGYAIGIDMSIRGTEDRSYRKSLDSFSVLGPWLVTADEIADPGLLDLELSVNGEMKQSSSTSFLIFDVPQLIAYASRAFTLHPGDIIMTGTPEGVGPVAPGDVMTARVEAVGEMVVEVRA
ncbi:MAG: fumarylacetoacetate hydrolase family protein [Hyphomicrobiales bacterium]